MGHVCISASDYHDNDSASPPHRHSKSTTRIESNLKTNPVSKVKYLSLKGKATFQRSPPLSSITSTINSPPYHIALYLFHS